MRSPLTPQPDLFGAGSSPEPAPVPTPSAALQLAFDDWLAARQAAQGLQQPSSVAVYRSMWEAFSRWCLQRSLRLQDLGVAELHAFLHERQAERMLGDRHAWRFLKLLDAVLAHAAARSRMRPNHAAADLLMSEPAWRHANASHRDPLPEFLDGSQARRLVAWLLDEHSGYAAPGAPAGSWQALRNRSAAALQLGAGLTPGDVRAALASGVALQGGRRAGLPWRIRVPAHGAAPERDAPIAPWAGRLLLRWLQARTGLGMPGDVLFPGTRAGRPWSKVAHYTASTSVLEAAAVRGTRGAPAGAGRAPAAAHGGSFLLRHTFALRQLARGHAPEEVARWLGVQDPAVMQRYQRVVFEPVDVA